jgi:hypothetical protein
MIFMKLLLMLMLSSLAGSLRSQAVTEQQLESRYQNVVKLKNKLFLVQKSYMNNVLVDQSGKEISDSYGELTEFTNGLMRGQSSKDHLFVLIDKNGKELSDHYNEMSKEIENDRIMVALNKIEKGSFGGNLFLYGYINSAGRRIIDCRYMKANIFRAGAAGVEPYKGVNEKGLFVGGNWQVIDINGNTLFEHEKLREYKRFDSAGTVSVQDFRVSYNGGTIGKIDKTGRLIVPPKYDEVGDFNNYGIASFKTFGKYGLLDNQGRELIPAKYTKLTYHNSGAFYVYIEQSSGIVSKNGQEILPPLKRNFIQAMGDNFWVVADYETKKMGVINASGASILPQNFGNVSFSNQHFITTLNGKQGLYQLNGKNIFPEEYMRIAFFGENMWALAKDGKWGFADSSSKLITPFKYDSAYKFSNGLASVHLNGKAALLNKKGIEITPFKYDFITQLYTGIRVFDLDKKSGLLNENGTEIIPARYDMIFNSSEGLTLVKLNGKFGYIDLQGQEKIGLLYDNAGNFQNGKAQVWQDGKSFFIDKTGNKVNP